MTNGTKQTITVGKATCGSGLGLQVRCGRAVWRLSGCGPSPNALLVIDIYRPSKPLWIDNILLRQLWFEVIIGTVMIVSARLMLLGCWTFGRLTITYTIFFT